ncbi:MULTISPECIES: NepR family anti-sigma factor [Methylobacterium]|uniref:NepR family anti-sigma factor n=1 Tax=Methylobacterium TaxID=407 RepID=UPI0010505420|nr:MULTISPECIES: NepR family anti-sigma factor [Methylobacterium]MDR7037454.1 hypothetical protein [Methylobacterium sp. BE186]
MTYVKPQNNRGGAALRRQGDLWMNDDGGAGDRPERGGGEKARGGSASDSRRQDSGAGLSEQTQRRIGNHLRAMYDAVIQQPVPDRFRDLIARLDASEPDKA